MATKINISGAGDRLATRMSLAIRVSLSKPSKPAPAVRIAVDRYQTGQRTTKQNIGIGGGIFLGAGVATVAGMVGLDQLSPIYEGASHAMNALKAGIYALPQAMPLLGFGGNVTYFGWRGVKQAWRFSGIAEAVIRADKAGIEESAQALRSLSSADQMLLTDVISKRKLELAKELRTKLSLPEVVTETPTEFVITPIQVKRDAQLAGIQEELGKVIMPTEPKAVEPAKPAALLKEEDIAQKVKRLEVAVKERDEKITALQAETVRLAQRGTEMLEAVKRELESKVAQKQCQMDEMGKQLNDLTQAGSQTAAQVAQMSSEREGLIKVNAALTQKVSELTAKVAEQDKALQAMHENFDKKGKAEIERLTAEIRAIESRMTAEINKKNNEIVTLKAEKGQMQAQMDNLAKERDGLAHENGALKGQLFNLSQSMEGVGAESRGKLVALEAERQQLKFQIQELYAQRNDASAKDKQVMQQIAQLQGKIDTLVLEAVNKDKAMGELKAERARLTEETAQMVAQLKEKMEALAQRAREEITKRDEQILKLSGDLSKEANEKVRLLEAEKEELAARMKDMEASYKTKVSALQAQLAASEITVQSPISLQDVAAAPIEGVEEYDKILGKLNKLNDSLEELKGPGQPTMGLAGIQKQLSYVIQVLVSMFTRMRGTYIEHQKMLAELKKFKELMSKVAPNVAQVHSDIQEFRKGQ